MNVFFAFVPNIMKYMFITGSTNRDNLSAPLNWEGRAKIALAVARGLSHIHSVGPKFAHGNIKSSNILLTMNNGARLSDHSIHSLASPIPSRVGRTGYLAPEVVDPTVTSHKGDIYSFGVLLLELLTGKAPAEVAIYGGTNLVKWVQTELRDGLADSVLQDCLVKDQSVEGDELVQFLQLAIDCTTEFPEMRPRMNDVVIRIVEILEVRAMVMAKGKNSKKPVNKPAESAKSVRTRYLW
jgi:serine/threonine protein kinase